MSTPARRASTGRGGRYGEPSSKSSPESGKVAPARTFISVLLPAPFSPMSACTCPGSAEKLTPPRATVAPNVFRTSRAMRRAAAKLFLEPLLEVGQNELYNVRLREVLFRHERSAGVDAGLDRLSFEMASEGFHGEVTHLERVL